MPLTRISVASVTCGCAAALVLVATVPVGAQRKPKPSSLSGTVEWRCTFTEASPALSCGNGDAIAGDGGDYQGTGLPESGEGAHLRDTGELWVGLRDGRMALRVDFSQPDGVAPCTIVGNCRLGGAYHGNLYAVIAAGYAEVQTNVVSPSNDGDTTPTLRDIPEDTPGWKARFNVVFNDPVYGLLWGFNFNPFAHAGSDLVDVYRVDACTWVFSAGPGATVGLSAYGRGPLGGKSYRTDEGRYLAPFELTFRVDAPCGG